MQGHSYSPGCQTCLHGTQNCTFRDLSPPHQGYEEVEQRSQLLSAAHVSRSVFISREQLSKMFSLSLSRHELCRSSCLRSILITADSSQVCRQIIWLLSRWLRYFSCHHLWFVFIILAGRLNDFVSSSSWRMGGGKSKICFSEARI